MVVIMLLYAYANAIGVMFVLSRRAVNGKACKSY
jgi:hypothetical protein